MADQTFSDFVANHLKAADDSKKINKNIFFK